MTTPRNVKMLRRAEAAEYLKATHGQPCTNQYLAKLATIGGGPNFQKAGRFPLYSPEELDRWALGRLTKPVASTAELLARESKLSQAPATIATEFPCAG